MSRLSDTRVPMDMGKNAAMASEQSATRQEPSDLVREMRALVAEEAFLWELTQQVTDYYGDAQVVVHGPWKAEDCQRILLRWFDAGLLDCTADAQRMPGASESNASWRARATEAGQHLILAREDARALLSDSTTWDQDGIGAAVMVCESDEADGVSFDDWFAALAGLPDHTIHWA